MNKKILFLTLMLFAGISASEAQEIFSKSFRRGTPVHITNNRDKGYAIKASNAGIAVASGTSSYTANELWYLVGNADNFTLYNYTAGEKMAVKLESYASGAAATMVSANDATPLTLTQQSDGSYTISPKGETGQSLNMFGGA